MLQLPLLLPGNQGLVKSAHGVGTNSAGGLASLLRADDGVVAGLSGDLQALLMQLSPQMLARLDDLLAGGMDLPQAASTLLGETSGGFGDDLFADFLRQRLPAAVDPGAAEAASRNASDARLLVALPERPPVAVPLIPDLQSAGAALSAVVGAHATTQGVPLPSQLANSLLDMGVPQAVGSKGWDSAIADRVMWMVQGEQQFARLKLNPPHLGPLEVRVSVNHDQASVSFIAQQAAVREALEAALPRLREMFDHQSLQLVRADVGDSGAQPRDQAPGSATRDAHFAGHWGGDPDDDRDPVVASVGHTLAKGLIDLFA